VHFGSFVILFDSTLNIILQAFKYCVLVQGLSCCPDLCEPSKLSIAHFGLTDFFLLETKSKVKKTKIIHKSVHFGQISSFSCKYLLILFKVHKSLDYIMDPAPMSAARYILPKKELNKAAPVRFEQFFALE